MVTILIFTSCNQSYPIYRFVPSQHHTKGLGVNDQWLMTVVARVTMPLPPLPPPPPTLPQPLFFFRVLYGIVYLTLAIYDTVKHLVRQVSPHFTTHFFSQ